MVRPMVTPPADGDIAVPSALAEVPPVPRPVDGSLPPVDGSLEAPLSKEGDLPPTLPPRAEFGAPVSMPHVYAAHPQLYDSPEQAKAVARAIEEEEGVMATVLPEEPGWRVFRLFHAAGHDPGINPPMAPCLYMGKLLPPDRVADIVARLSARYARVEAQRLIHEVRFLAAAVPCPPRHREAPEPGRTRGAASLL